jgi:hypothetical protein
MAPRRSATRSSPVSFSAAGDTVVIASPSIGPINVYGLFLTVNGATLITFKDSSVGALSGPFNLTGNGSSMSFVLQDEPWWQIKPGSNYVINSSNAVQVSGQVWYTLG